MKRRILSLAFSALLLALIMPFDAHPHGDEGGLDEIDEFGDSYPNHLSYTWAYVGIGIFAVGLLVILAVFFKNKLGNTHKKILYFSTAAIISIVTLYLLISTLSINIMSETKGPVHWHADFEIWNCGERIDIMDSRGLSNKVGTSVFHEHNDNRIHVEGVVAGKRHVDIHSFFRVIGGYIGGGNIGIPTNRGFLEIRDGNPCNGKPGKLQAFVFKVTNPESAKEWRFRREKLDDFEDYILSPYSNVPPGDCIIIEFDGEKDFTDKICPTFSQSMQKGELIGD